MAESWSTAKAGPGEGAAMAAGGGGSTSSGPCGRSRQVGVERFLSRCPDVLTPCRRPGRGRLPHTRARPEEAGPAKPAEGQQAMTRTITSDLVEAYSHCPRKAFLLMAG